MAAAVAIQRVITTPMATMAFKAYTGVVVSAGKMDKTVKVRIPQQKWNRKIKKVRPQLPH